MIGVNKWQGDFMVEIIGLFLSIKRKINFLQLGRYGGCGEQRYRNQFEKNFDFMEFNSMLVKEKGSGHYTIAFDPSHINKSGKHTFGVGYFWSGCAGKAKWGLEIGGIAAIDIENHTGFHLEAVQTPGKLGSKSLLNHYSQLLTQRKTQLQSLSKYVVADAYFSKKPFVNALKIADFETVSRFRDDANLRYLYDGPPTGKRGHPKKYDGKVDYNSINAHYLKTEILSENQKFVYGTLYAVALKRKVNVVIVYTKTKDKWKHKIYFATDLLLCPHTLLEYYNLFQKLILANSARFKLYKKFQYINDTLTILDIGCGSGVFATFLKREKIRVKYFWI